jgi:hypothetical protein
MPAYYFKNLSTRDKAIRVFGGTETVKAGASVILENALQLSQAQIKDFAEMGVIVTVPAISKSAKTQPKIIKG